MKRNIHHKGQKLREKIDKALSELAKKDVHNAMEKILIKEYIIRKEIEREIKNILIFKKLKIAKGVIILEEKNKVIKEDSADCDILIFKNREQEIRDGIVIVKKRDAKIVVSIVTHSSRVKNPRRMRNLSKKLARNGIDMVVLSCDNTLSKEPKHLRGLKYFSLNIGENPKEHYGFEALLDYLHSHLKKTR